MLAVAMTHRVRIRPVRVREYDDALAVDRSRVIGYRAVCGCGWRGSKRATVRVARGDRLVHLHGA